MSHEFRHGRNVHAVKDSVRAERVAEHVGAQIRRQIEPFLEVAHPLNQSITGPGNSAGIQKNVGRSAATAQYDHELSHGWGQIYDAGPLDLVGRFVFLRDPAVFLYLVPAEHTRLDGAATRLLQHEKQEPEIAPAVPQERTVFLVGHDAIAWLGSRAFHAMERVAMEDALLASPRKGPVNGSAGVAARRVVPSLGVQPAGQVDGLEFRNQQIARVLGKLLAVPAIVAIGISRAVDFRPREEGLDDIGDAGGGGLRRLCSLDGQLVEFLLGELAARPALGQADSLAGDGDHPPANVFAEPDFVGTRHCQISGQKSLEKSSTARSGTRGPRLIFFSEGVSLVRSLVRNRG